MKRFVVACVLMALGLVATPQEAKAVPFTGSVDYVGTHTLVNSGDFTANTFVTINTATVLLTTGVFTGLGVSGAITHASPITYVPPTVPVPPPLWSHAGSGVEFVLGTMSAVVNPLTLILSGNGMFQCFAAPCSPTYNPTPGFWVMTMNIATGQVSGTFSSSAAVPEPGVLALLGLGLLGAARTYRARRQR
jgi:hypothetical protein